MYWCKYEPFILYVCLPPRRKSVKESSLFHQIQYASNANGKIRLVLEHFAHV